MTDPDAPPFVRPDVQAFMDLVAQAGGKKVHESTVDEARLSYHKLNSFAEAPPVELPVIRDLAAPGPACDIPLRYYDTRERSGPSPVVLFMHGGGFVIGDIESHHSFCTAFAEGLDLPVISVDYRLAPEHPFPAAPLDCIAVARWLAGGPASLPFTPSGLIPCGDSAGGNLATVVSLALTREPAAVPLVAQCAIYPVLDSSKNWESFRLFAEGYFLDIPSMRWFDKQYGLERGSPLHDTLAAEVEGLPPTLVVTASLDPLRDQGRAYHAKLEEHGVTSRLYEAEGTVHGFIHIRRGIPSANDDVARIIDELRALVDGVPR